MVSAKFSARRLTAEVRDAMGAVGGYLRSRSRAEDAHEKGIKKASKLVTKATTIREELVERKCEVLKAEEEQHATETAARASLVEARRKGETAAKSCVRDFRIVGRSTCVITERIDDDAVAAAAAAEALAAGDLELAHVAGEQFEQAMRNLEEATETQESVEQETERLLAKLDREQTRLDEGDEARRKFKYVLDKLLKLRRALRRAITTRRAANDRETDALRAGGGSHHNRAWDAADASAAAAAATLAKAAAAKRELESAAKKMNPGADDKRERQVLEKVRVAVESCNLASLARPPSPRRPPVRCATAHRPPTHATDHRPETRSPSASRVPKAPKSSKRTGTRGTYSRPRVPDEKAPTPHTDRPSTPTPATSVRISATVRKSLGVAAAVARAVGKALTSDAVSLRQFDGGAPPSAESEMTATDDDELREFLQKHRLPDVLLTYLRDELGATCSIDLQDLEQSHLNEIKTRILKPLQFSRFSSALLTLQTPTSQPLERVPPSSFRLVPSREPLRPIQPQVAVNKRPGKETDSLCQKKTKITKLRGPLVEESRVPPASNERLTEAPAAKRVESALALLSPSTGRTTDASRAAATAKQKKKPAGSAHSILNFCFGKTPAGGIKKFAPATTSLNKTRKKEDPVTCPMCQKTLKSGCGFDGHLRMAHKMDRKEDREKFREDMKAGRRSGQRVDVGAARCSKEETILRKMDEDARAEVEAAIVATTLGAIVEDVALREDVKVDRLKKVNELVGDRKAELARLTDRRSCALSSSTCTALAVVECQKECGRLKEQIAALETERFSLTGKRTCGAKTRHRPGFGEKFQAATWTRNLIGTGMAKMEAYELAANHFGHAKTNIVKWAGDSKYAEIKEYVEKHSQAAAKRKKSSGRGGRVKFPQVEEELHQEFLEMRRSGRRVTSRWLRISCLQLMKKLHPDVQLSQPSQKGRELRFKYQEEVHTRQLTAAPPTATSKKRKTGADAPKTFKASRGWVKRFMLRKKIRARKKTNIKHKSAEERKAVCQKFHCQLRKWKRRRKSSNIHWSDTYGRISPCNTWNLDEVPMNFVPFDKTLADVKGIDQERVHIKQPVQTDKRFCTLVSIIRADGKQSVPPVLIFFGAGTVEKRERKYYDDSVKVIFQKKAWCGRPEYEKIAEHVAKHVAPDYNRAALFNGKRPENEPTKLLLVDNLDAHLQKPARRILWERARMIQKTFPGGNTDHLQPVDAGDGAQWKAQLANEIDLWLMDDKKNFDIWESKMKAREKRIVLTKLVGKVYRRRRDDQDADCFRRLFEKTGCLISIDGTSLDKIQPQGMVDYSVPSDDAGYSSWATTDLASDGDDDDDDVAFSDESAAEDEACTVGEASDDDDDDDDDNDDDDDDEDEKGAEVPKKKKTKKEEATKTSSGLATRKTAPSLEHDENNDGDDEDDDDDDDDSSIMDLCSSEEEDEEDGDSHPLVDDEEMLERAAEGQSVRAMVDLIEPKGQFTAVSSDCSLLPGLDEGGLVGWVILMRHPLYIGKRIVGTKWFKGKISKVNGSGAAAGSHNVRVSWDGEGPLDHELRPEDFSDGSNVPEPEKSPFIRLLTNDEYRRSTRSYWDTTKLPQFLRRIGRQDIDEVGDGHCGFRALIRFLLLLEKVEGGPPAPTPNSVSDTSLIAQAREYVAKALETHSDAIAKAAVFKHRDPNDQSFSHKRRQRIQQGSENESRLIQENANVIRNAAKKKSTMNRKEWFGGECRIHWYAVAMEAQVPVHCLTHLQEKVATVLPDGKETTANMNDFTPGESDIFLYYVNQNHYHSLVPSTSTA